jgi:hypothetical protein
MRAMLEYAKWQLSATIGNVSVSAFSISEQHRDKTLKVWRGMRAKNIVVVERPDALALPVWKVRVSRSGSYQDIEIAASSEKIALSKIASDKKLKLKQWQVLTAKIERVKELA